MEGIGWSKSGDFKPSEKYKPFFPKLSQAIFLIPTVLRLLIFYVREWWRGNGFFINIFDPRHHYPHTGVPLGGIGAGSIGTDFRGGFRDYSLIPGIKERLHHNVKGNQFILSVFNKAGKLIKQQCLSGADYPKSPLSSWKHAFEKTNISYCGLYPRSWTQFRIPELGLELLCEAISPVLPDDYKDSSLPVSNFVWSVRNNSSEDYRIALTFTFRNGTGTSKWNGKGECRASFTVSDNLRGAQLEHEIKEMPVTYGIFTDGTLPTTLGTFKANSTGKDIWESITVDGITQVASVKEAQNLGIAACQTFELNSKCETNVEYALVWHMPVVYFGKASRPYRRRYTRFFPVDSSGTGLLGLYALKKRSQWQKAIEAWQSPIIENSLIPEWFRSALFNESYYVSDGSMWFEYDEEWAEVENLSPQTVEHMKEYGRFGYMESWEYLMINTYDVHFYSSFALLANWPQLEMSVQLDFCDQVFSENRDEATSLQEGTNMIRKTRGRIPHDMGHPFGDPWLSVNAYCLHDTAEWKDLNLKFVLLSYRDYVQIAKNDNGQKNRELLSFFYERSKFIIDRGLQDWDSDGDGLIENSGTADQTYDIWRMSGTSAYCGSLWLASVECLCRMAEELEEEKEVTGHYRSILSKAREAFVRKLWNGSYFDFDEHSGNKDTIMADQLCGLWFLSMIDKSINTELIDSDKITKSLATIYEFNHKKFKEGRLGPVNGMRPDGTVDTCSIQSEEVWSGTAYAVASYMIMNNQLDSGFDVGRGIHNTCWNELGLQYQTPEAIYGKHYRAIGYMRPLSIWSMWLAFRNQQNLEK